MKNFTIQKYRTPTLVLIGSLSLFTLVFTASAFASVVSRPFSGIAALATAALVSAFVGRFQLRLPRSSTILPVPVLFALWGLFWFGNAGGVALGVISTILNLWPARKQNNNFVVDICSMSASIIVAVSIFSFLFETAANFGYRVNGLSFEVVQLIVTGSLLVAGIFVLVSLGFALAVDRLMNTGHASRFAETSAAGLLMALVTMVVCLCFSHFGIEFGLVIAPITIFANIAYSIHIATLAQKTKQISDASRVHLATVEALATAIDARDQVGLGHVQRTQIFAVGLAKLMGLGENDINAIRTGALLHDIGKLAVPDHILNKPEKLTPAELEKTKVHSLVGASILEKIDFDCPVVPTVKYHHECWNGKGYPEGLKGEEIPLTARILSVADAYDTLRGARPYRPAIPRDLARQMILDEAGVRFDPSIVRCFIKNLSQLELEIDAQGFAYAHDDKIISEVERRGHNYVDQIKLANREVFTLYELAREFSSSVNLQEMLALFTKKIGEFVPFMTCAVFLLDEKKKYATAIHVDGDNSSILLSRRIKIGQGETGYALKMKKTVRNGNPELDLSFSNELDGQYSTMASVPLIADQELVGAVSIYSCEPGGYCEEHLRLLETIARIAAEAISKSLEHDEVRTYALTDPMTGLPNARSLQIEFEKETARASRSGSSFQVLMLDLDGFKAVNDSFGHKVGDDMLREVAKVIREQLRDYDFLARYGGDEFVALLPETGPEDVAELCQRIEKGVVDYKLYVENDMYASVGVSIGSAGYPAHGETFDQMMVAADKAMYRRKTRRRVDPSNFIISGYDINLEIMQETVEMPRAIDDAMQETIAFSFQHEDMLQDTAEIPRDILDKDELIVELDETHVMASTAVN